MATSTDIQYLGAVGDPSAGNDDGQSYRTQIETFLAGGTIGAGDAVAFDSSKTDEQKVLYVIEATAAAGALVVGIALNAAAAGEKVAVVVAGFCNSANVATGVAVGQPLYTTSTAGRLGSAAGFLSTEITGIAPTEQSTAHGLGVVPSLAFAVATELTGGAFDVVYGTHTATDVKFTVTNGEKYRAVAFGGGQGTPVAVALSAESSNSAQVFVIKRF
jgi:hypothetical protein